MFLGMKLRPDFKHSIKVTKPFHLSSAVLEENSSSVDSETKIVLTTGCEDFLICTLKKGEIEHASLNLDFDVGEEFDFKIIGTCHVALNGYFHDLKKLKNLRAKLQDEKRILEMEGSFDGCSTCSINDSSIDLEQECKAA